MRGTLRLGAVYLFRRNGGALCHRRWDGDSPGPVELYRAILLTIAKNRSATPSGTAFVLHGTVVFRLFTEFTIALYQPVVAVGGHALLLTDFLHALSAGIAEHFLKLRQPLLTCPLEALTVVDKMVVSGFIIDPRIGTKSA